MPEWVTNNFNETLIKCETKKKKINTSNTTRKSSAQV